MLVIGVSVGVIFMWLKKDSNLGQLWARRLWCSPDPGWGRVGESLGSAFCSLGEGHIVWMVLPYHNWLWLPVHRVIGPKLVPL